MFPLKNSQTLLKSLNATEMWRHYFNNKPGEGLTGQHVPSFAPIVRILSIDSFGAIVHFPQHEHRSSLRRISHYNALSRMVTSMLISRPVYIQALNAIICYVSVFILSVALLYASVSSKVESFGQIVPCSVDFTVGFSLT